MIGGVLRGRYELIQSIGETPLFNAFSARDRLQGRDVALRVLKSPFSEESEFVTKLAEIVRGISSVQNPGLERLYSVDGDPTAQFLVSELSRGTVLVERLRKLGTLSVPVAVQTGIAICEAVQTLHSAGIAHGDLGSHNVTIAAEGELKVQLYALWQAFSASKSAGMEMLPVMAPYIAPEIVQGGLPTPSSDVYAIGVILYEMLSGRYPYHADSPAAMAQKHVTDATPNVRMMNPSVPVVLAEIVKKAMGKSSEERYKDASDLVSDLRILQDALRFGRTLSWPIREESRPAPPQPVAPKMSAIREPEKTEMEDDEPFEEEDPADVPKWIKGLIAFFAVIVLTMAVLWVVFNMNKPRMVTVPDLKRLSRTEATNRLKALGLKFRISGKESNESVPKDQVLDASPPPGDKVYEGSMVSVQLSMGSKFVEAPDVRGMKLDAAKTLLGSVDLQLDDHVDMVKSREIPAGQIVSQTPEAHSKLQRTSRIRVSVSNGNKDTVVDNKDAKTTYEYTITIKLIDIEDPVNLRVDITDARGTRTVHEATHQPNDEVPVLALGYGKKVTFRIYYDGELVKQQDAEATPSEEDSNNSEESSTRNNKTP